VLFVPRCQQRKSAPGAERCLPFRRGKHAIAAATLVACFAAVGAASGQTCPTEDPAIDAAKSNKVYLYFPTTSDSTFPNYGTNVSPVAVFDVASLSPGIGTTTQLIDEIHSIVVDDYCEFNAQVLATTTNPDLLPNPPARRVTVGIGADNNQGSTWGGGARSRYRRPDHRRFRPSVGRHLCRLRRWNGADCTGRMFDHWVSHGRERDVAPLGASDRWHGSPRSRAYVRPRPHRRRSAERSDGAGGAGAGPG
jgi:hypothetical protein